MFRHAAGFFLTSVLAAGAQTMPPGITRTQLLDNASVMVARLRMAPGARETVHTHPFSAVIVQLDPGEVEMRVGTRRETARRERGHVDFIAAEMPQVVHDLPAGAKRLTQRCRGIVATVVNGEVLLREGQHTGALPGRLLRGPLARV